VTQYAAEIWRLRHFLMALVRVDLRKRYRRSVIGIGWSLLQPIAMTVVLCVVFSQVFKSDVRSYASLLLTGLTFWAFITSVVMQGCQCFFLGESYIRQHPAPLAIYPLRTTLGAGFHFLLGLAISLMFVWCVQGFGNVPALLSLVPTLGVLFIVGWSVAVCMGVANVMFQDSQHLVEVALQILFYVTPIMYGPDLLADRPRLAWLVGCNPLAILLDLIRRPILTGEFPPPQAMCLGVLIALIAAGAATLALSRLEKRIIFYL
jgi:lipopolysaccharide transport system permease protein